MQLGFVGLGAMGLPMTRHLLEAGHQVTVASRSPGPVDRAVSLGAVDGGSPAAVAAAGEVVILCVPSSPQVAEVVDLPCCRRSARARWWWTAPPSIPTWPGPSTQRVTATGAGFLDAPLSGGTAGAEKGTLTLMVGGDAATLDTVAPGPRALRRAGRPRRRAGDGPGGQAVQQPHLRGPDGGHLGGHRAGGEVRGRPGQALRGARPFHRGLRGRPHPAARWPAWCRTARPPTGGGPAS